MTWTVLSRTAITVLFIALHGCSVAHTASSPPAGGSKPRFGMHFFRAQVPGGYDYEPLWEAVRDLDPASAVASINETDVVAYEIDEAPSLCAAIRLTGRAAAGVRAALAGVHEGPVLVTLEGAPLYAAREYLIHGAASFRYPVVHLDDLDRGEIKVCAVQGAAAAGLGDDVEARRIDREELRALFDARGVLREVPKAGRSTF